jgi:hypothetical protein
MVQWDKFIYKYFGFPRQCYTDYLIQILILLTSELQREKPGKIHINKFSWI